jgi:hypothetical protein
MKVVIGLHKKETASIHKRIQERDMLLTNRQKSGQTIKRSVNTKKAVKILKEYQHKKG